MRQAVEFQSRAAILHSDFGETKSIPSMTSLRNFLALKPCSPRGIRDAIWFLSLDCSRLKTQPGLNRKCVPLFHGICHPLFWDLKPGYPKTLPNKYGPHWHLVTTSLTASQGNCWDLLAVSCCSATSRQTFSWFSWSSSPSLLKNLDKLRRKTQCSTWHSSCTTTIGWSTTVPIMGATYPFVWVLGGSIMSIMVCMCLYK